MLFMDAHSHAHLLSGTANAWPDIMICCGTHAGDWPAVAAWCAEHPGAYAAYGVHPWYADACADALVEDLAQRLQADATAGVGEIGLHFAKAWANRAEQMACFAAQLQLGCTYGRTVSIHCVHAWGPLLTCLDAVADLRQGRILVHDFSGSVEIAHELVGRGVFLSCRPSAQRSRLSQVVASVDRNYLLVERDAGGQPGEQVYDCRVLEDSLSQMAAWRGEPLEELRAVVCANGERVVGRGNAEMLKC